MKKVNTVLQSLFSAILLIASIILVFLHNKWNLMGPWEFHIRATESNSEVLIRLLNNQLKKTATMNTIEISIWILLPILFIFLALMPWTKRKVLSLTITFIVAILLYSLAWTTNLIGVNRRIEKDLPHILASFEEAQYPNVNQYNLLYEKDFSNGTRVFITFESNDSLEKAEGFYLAKGFGQNSLDLQGRSSLQRSIAPGNVDIHESEGKIKISYYRPLD